MSEVTLRARLEGVEDVTGGFERMGNAAGNMGNKVSSSSKQMDMNYRQLMVTTAGLIGNSVQLGDIMDRMAKGQLDVGKGALMLTMNFMQLASQLYTVYTKYGAVIAAKAAAVAVTIQEAGAHLSASAAMAIHTAASWAHVIAENARAIASAIANAVSSLGVAVPIIIGAAAAATVGILALQGRIPSFAGGGVVYQPTYALIGEKEPEGVFPLSKLPGYKTVTIGSIIINEAKTPRETGDAVIDTLRRRGAI